MLRHFTFIAQASVSYLCNSCARRYERGERVRPFIAAVTKGGMRFPGRKRKTGAADRFGCGEVQGLRRPPKTVAA